MPPSLITPGGIATIVQRRRGSSRWSRSSPLEGSQPLVMVLTLAVRLVAHHPWRDRNRTLVLWAMVNFATGRSSPLEGSQPVRRVVVKLARIRVDHNPWRDRKCLARELADRSPHQVAHHPWRDRN